MVSFDVVVGVVFAVVVVKADFVVIVGFCVFKFVIVVVVIIVVDLDLLLYL